MQYMYIEICFNSSPKYIVDIVDMIEVSTSK